MASRTSTLLAVFVLAILQPAISLWIPTLAEEFTAVKQLNSLRWIPAFYWQPDPSPNNELQTYRPDAFNFSSSTSLGLRASIGFKNGYNAGVISSKDRFTQTLGYFEFQARLPTAKGVMASFGLLRQDTTVANQSISIQVVLSNPTTVYFTQQCGPSTLQNNSVFQNITDLRLHKFGIEWAFDATNFYIDGIQIYSQRTCVAVGPMYIVSNLVVGGPLAGSPDNSTAFPVTMDLDYIRAYQYSSKEGVSLAGPGDGVPNPNLVVVAEPRVTLSYPSISSNIAHIGDTITFNITIAGGGSLVDTITAALDQALVEISLFQMADVVPLSLSQFTNVTLLSQDSMVFTATVPLQEALPGYYRFALAIYESNRTRIIGFNTVEVLQVIASPSPPVPSVVPVTLAPTSTTTSNVVPILDCYTPINTTHYRAYFSYDNKNNAAVLLPIGDRNKITPGSTDRGQPTIYSTGRSALFPNSVFVTDIDSNIEWVLSNYKVDVDVTDTSSLCPNSVTIVIVVSSPSSSLNATNIEELKEVTASQLNVTSADVQINVTCTSATSCEISVTISANPSQISELIQKAKNYATDPATVEKNLKQVSTDLSVTEVRGAGSNTEKPGSVAIPGESSEPVFDSNAIIIVQSQMVFVVLLAFILFILILFC